MTLSELEWLGLELALRRRFLLEPAPAAILTALLRRGPQAGPALAAQAGITEGSLKPILHRLRHALRELGLGAKVVCVRHEGYRLSPGADEEIWGRVRQELAA